MNLFLAASSDPVDSDITPEATSSETAFDQPSVLASSSDSLADVRSAAAQPTPSNASSESSESTPAAGSGALSPSILPTANPDGL